MKLPVLLVTFQIFKDFFSASELQTTFKGFYEKKLEKL